MSGTVLPVVALHVGVAPESSVAVKFSVTLVALVSSPLVGELIVIAGGVLSRRVTVAVALPELLAASVQVTVKELAPKASDLVDPEVSLQLGVAPESSTAVKLSVVEAFVVVLP